MVTLFSAFPFLTRLFADGGYQGPQFKDAIRRTLAAVTVESVKRSDCKRADRVDFLRGWAPTAA